MPIFGWAPAALKYTARGRVHGHATKTWASRRPAMGTCHRRRVARWIPSELFVLAYPAMTAKQTCSLSSRQWSQRNKQFRSRWQDQMIVVKYRVFVAVVVSEVWNSTPFQVEKKATGSTFQLALVVHFNWISWCWFTLPIQHVMKATVWATWQAGKRSS
jgi:hypothetical protein